MGLGSLINKVGHTVSNVIPVSRAMDAAGLSKVNPFGGDFLGMDYSTRAALGALAGGAFFGAPALMGSFGGAGGAGGAMGGLDMFSPEAGEALTSEFGGAGGAGGAGGGGGILSKLSAANDWMGKNRLITSMGLGLGLGGLQAYQASQQARANQQSQREILQRQQERQALMDNPPAYAGMNIRPPQSTNVALDPLATYGQRPEARFFNAHGGLPASGPMRMALPSPRGGLEQARMVDGDGGGQDDQIPAMLSAKEYVMDADTVSALGDGNPDEGARRLDQMRANLRRHKRSAPSHKIPPKARAPESYLRRAA